MNEGPQEFERWYRAVHPRLVASLSHAFADPSLAREAVDEAIVRAYERWDDVGAMASPGGWTYRVAFNVVRRRQRRTALERRLLMGRRTEDAAPPTGELWEVVADLPDRQRQAVVLRHVAHLREHEIADVMGISRGAVSSTLRAAYRRLRIQIDDDAKDHGGEKERAQ